MRPIKSRSDTEIGTAATINEIMHVPRAVCSVHRFCFVIFEIVSISCHGNRYPAAIEQSIQRREFFVADTRVLSARKPGVTYDCHDEFPVCTIERPFEP